MSLKTVKAKTKGVFGCVSEGMKILLVLITLALVCSFAKEAIIDTTYDEFEDHTIIRTSSNKLQGESDEEIYLDISLSINVKKDSSLLMGLMYFGKDWLFIREGESMIVLADGNRIPFKSLLHRNDAHEYGVSECHMYTSDNLIKDLQTMAYADSVKIKISGEKGYTIQRFQQENFNIFQRFLEEVLLLPKPSSGEEQ